jgi:hypothetical protein
MLLTKMPVVVGRATAAGIVWVLDGPGQEEFAGETISGGQVTPTVAAIGSQQTVG